MTVPLQMGAWTMVFNGQPGLLMITKVDPQGNVAGTLSLDYYGLLASIEGFWDEVAGALTFSTYYPNPASPPRGVLQFVGYMFKDTFRLPGIQGTNVYTLTGDCQGFTGVATNIQMAADQNQFAWYAQIGEA
jgi:hypothetical protein